MDSEATDPNVFAQLPSADDLAEIVAEIDAQLPWTERIFGYRRKAARRAAIYRALVSLPIRSRKSLESFVVFAVGDDPIADRGRALADAMATANAGPSGKGDVYGFAILTMILISVIANLVARWIWNRIHRDELMRIVEGVNR